jgi:hypothetical protein
MSNRQSVRPWLITDILSFLLSLASPLALIPVGMIFFCFLVPLGIIAPLLELFFSPYIGDGFVDPVLAIISMTGTFLLSSYLAHLGLGGDTGRPARYGENSYYTYVWVGLRLISLCAMLPARLLVRYRPAGVPERRSARLWWGLLPVGVVLAATAGLLLNPKMMQPATFVGLFGLLAFGGVLIADRTLTLVRTVTDRQVRFTVTTMFVGYVLAGSTLGVMTLTFERPAYLYEALVEDEEGWAGLGMVYILPLALARTALVLAGRSRLGMDLTLSQVAEGVPLLFDAETGDGMFTALAITLVGIPATLGLVETAWRGRRWIPSYLRFRRTVSKAEDRLDTAQQKFDRGEYEQVTELLAGDDVEQTLDRCQQLARESDSWLSKVESLRTEYDTLRAESALEVYNRELDTVVEHLEAGRLDQSESALGGAVETARERCHQIDTGSAGRRREKLDERLQRLETRQEVERLAEQQDAPREEYEQARTEERFDEAAAKLDDAEELAEECSRRADGLDIDYSLPLSLDDIERERADLAEAQFESVLAAYEDTLDTVAEHLEMGRLDQAETALGDTVETARERCHRLDEQRVSETIRHRRDELDKRLQRLETRQEVETAREQQEKLRAAYEDARSKAQFDEAAAVLDEAETIVVECSQCVEGLDVEYSLPLSADDIETERRSLDRQRTESALQEGAERFQNAVDSAVEAVHDGDFETAGSAVETAERERTALARLEATYGDVTAPLSPDERNLVSRVREAVAEAVEAQFDTDIAGTFECDDELFWPEASARYRLAAAGHAAETDDYERALETVETAQATLAETLQERSDAGEQAALEQLQTRARNQREEYREALVVAMMQRATDCPPAEYTTASRLLEQVLEILPNVEAFDQRERSIIRFDAYDKYVTARCDGAVHLVEQGRELRDDDTTAAVDQFERAMTVLEETDDKVTHWVDEGALDDRSDLDTDRLREVRTQAENGYLKLRSAAIKRTIQTGAEQFERERYDEAGETFRNAEADAAAAADRVEGDQHQERLEHLQQVASQNAATADRAALGVLGDSPSLQDPTREAEPRAVSTPRTGSEFVSTEAADRRPSEIPTSPSLELSSDEVTDGEVIGRGGNADVYQVTVQRREREIPVAVKQPRLEGTMERDRFGRTLKEAKNWQQLDDHNHIVSVLDYGSEPLPWIGMEYMDAGHLGERAGAMNFPQALWTALVVTRGVRHAHRRGVAHLDLKPANVLFRSIEGAWDAPMVADWGLSKHLLEHSNSVEGMSPYYAAPEQFDDAYGSPDDITDIYQLGAVFYELFTGRPPFEGQPFRVIDKVKEEDPTPPSEVADVPEALDEVLLTALATEKADRYEHVLYLRDDLQTLCDGP